MPPPVRAAERPAVRRVSHNSLASAIAVRQCFDGRWNHVVALNGYRGFDYASGGSVANGQANRASSVDDRAKGGFLDGFLTTIERVGNMVPHPGDHLLLLIGLVIVLSVILSFVGWSATYEAIDPVTHEVVTQTTTVRSLLSADGIRFLFTSIVPNFMNFGAVGVIIVAMIGVGVAEESGLIATLVRKIVEIAPQSIFTFIIVMLGVVSSIAADAGYLVLVPLGAAAFHSLGRHPLAGLAAAFSGVAAVFLVNLFVTPTDALLAEMTNDAIRLVDPAREVTLVGNLYFMIASSILMGIVCTILTEKVVEPHLGPYEGGVPVEGQAALTPSQSRGLRCAGWALLGYVVVVGLLLLPPGAPLRHPETGEILSGSPFMSGLIVQISALFFTVGYAYGKGAGHGEGPDRGDQHGGQDLRRHGRADLPPAGHRPVHRLLQLHQHRDGAGGEPRRLPRDRAARRRRATSSSSCW